MVPVVVADPEAHAVLLLEHDVIAFVAAPRHLGAIPDGRHALERRDQRHLGGLDDAADADLAGGQGADP